MNIDVMQRGCSSPVQSAKTLDNTWIIKGFFTL